MRRSVTSIAGARRAEVIRRDRKIPGAAPLQLCERAIEEAFDEACFAVDPCCLAFLPALSTAHDGGVDVTRGHGQIADLTLGTPLPMPVTPPENV